MTEVAIRDTRRPGHFWADNEVLDVYGPKIGAYGVAIYMVLSRHANNETAQTFVSVKKICEKLAISKSTIKRAVAKMEEVGLIRVSSSADGQNSNVYTLLEIARGGSIGTPFHENPVPIEPEGGSIGTPNYTNNNHTKPLNSVPSLEESPAKEAKDPRFPLFVDSLDKYWKHKNGDLAFTFGAADGKALKRFLAENPRLTVLQFQQALRNRAKSNVTHSLPVRFWISKALETYNGSLDRFGKHSATVANEPPRGQDDLADVIRQRGGPDALKRRHAERNSTQEGKCQ